jgi:hypothetical protein
MKRNRKRRSTKQPALVKLVRAEKRKESRMKYLLVAAMVTAGVWLATPAWADPFFFSTGTLDGLLGALSQPASTASLETETADDFILTETTSIAQATIIGLIPSGTPLANIENVEIEVYHVFPNDSDVGRTLGPPTFSTAQVPTRMNSPSDVEIDDATREVVSLHPTDNSFARKAGSIPQFNLHGKGTRWYATHFSTNSCCSRCSGWECTEIGGGNGDQRQRIRPFSGPRDRQNLTSPLPA